MFGAAPFGVAANAPVQQPPPQQPFGQAAPAFGATGGANPFVGGTTAFGSQKPVGAGFAASGFGAGSPPSNVFLAAAARASPFYQQALQQGGLVGGFAAPVAFDGFAGSFAGGLAGGFAAPDAHPVFGARTPVAPTDPSAQLHSGAPVEGGEEGTGNHKAGGKN